MMKKISRRNLLKACGLATTGYVVSVVARLNEVSARENEQKPWQYHPVDPKMVADLAYKNYKGHGCMYAVASSILGILAEAHGQQPYENFPLQMLDYGHGGAGGYGSLCGSINGGAMVIGLFCNNRKQSDQMISNLFQWYEQTALPIYKPPTAEEDKEMPQAVTNSVLCHASISNWCMEAKVGPKDPFRTERCKRLSADIAAKVVEILNDYDQQEIAPFAMDVESQKCLECHGVEEAVMFRSTTKMSCNSCHSDPHNQTLK
jgi:hypothetical protein